MSNWIKCGKTWDEVRGILVREGMQIELRPVSAHSASKKSLVLHLVGTINVLGGECDCCHINGRDTIVRYRTLVSAEQLRGE
jgi:hypothetical protein